MNALKALALGLGFAAISAAANAATISYTDSFSSRTPIETTLNLTQFNPSLGNLASLSLLFEGSLDGSISVTNVSLARRTITASQDVDFTFTGPGVGSRSFSIDSGPRSFTLDPNENGSFAYSTPTAPRPERWSIHRF